MKLAKLNPSDATEAAKHAREKSTVLLPLKFQDLEASQSDLTISNASADRSMGIKEASEEASEHVIIQSESSEHSGIQSESSKGSTEHVRILFESSEQDGIQSESLFSSPFVDQMSKDVNYIMNIPYPLDSISSEEPIAVEDPHVDKTITEKTIVKSPGEKDGFKTATDGLPVCHATILPSMEHRTWICTTPVHEECRDNETSLGPQRGGLINPATNGSGTVYWDRAAGQFRLLPDMSRTLKVSTHSSGNVLSALPVKKVPGHEACGQGLLTVVGGQNRSSLGKSPIISSVNVEPSLLEGPLRLMPSNRNIGKENSLELMVDDANQHMLRLSSNQSGLSVGRSLSILGAPRTMPRSILLSRFTPS
mgnify:CR=1 FL=1